MANPVPMRRLRWRRQLFAGSRPRLHLLAVAAAPLTLISLGTTAAARPSLPAPSAALLPSVLPSVCVGGTVLCGGSVVTLPTSPPVAVPSVCVGPACSGDVVGTGTPPPQPGASGSGPRPAPAATAPAPAAQAGRPVAAPAPVSQPLIAALPPLPAPPGVGLIGPAGRVSAQDGLGPDTYATVMSLSLGDGLGGVRYHVWPWLLGLQLLLWTVIAVVAWSRRLNTPAKPQRG